ncbi:MAG: carboxylate-amine ligase [Dongiaceae bacterium]
MKEPAFTMGIEEEYLLVDRGTRDLVQDAPPGLFEECQKALKTQVSPEFLRSQIEVGTGVCHSIQEARADLARLRGTVAEIAGKYGLAPIAASTHPFAAWHEQRHTDKERYNMLARDLQGAARRLLICGMHVHIGIEDPEMRIDFMSQIGYFLPHLRALSTSSPFWNGEDTGLKSYRVSVFDELPRTGLPEQFDSFGEFERHLKVLINAGVIEDGTKLWWDVRPSVRFPTLEMRLTDICTRLDDGIAIAAIYRCLLRMLWRLRRSNQRWRRYAAMLINENRWRAQRYGVDQGLVDFGKGEIVPYAHLLEEILELIAEDAEHFGCTAAVARARDILTSGTSAHQQTRIFREALEAGVDRENALKSVVDWLVEETVRGL